MRKRILLLQGLLLLLVTCVPLKSIKTHTTHEANTQSSDNREVRKKRNDAPLIGKDNTNLGDIYDSAIKNQRQKDTLDQTTSKIIVDNDDVKGSNIDYNYTISYSVYDSSGNETKKTVDVNGFTHNYVLGSQDDAKGTDNAYIPNTGIKDIQVHINASYQPNTYAVFDSRHSQEITYAMLLNPTKTKMWYTIQASGILSCPKIVIIAHWNDNSGKEVSTPIGRYGVYNFYNTNGAWAISTMATLTPIALTIGGWFANGVAAMALIGFVKGTKLLYRAFRGADEIAGGIAGDMDDFEEQASGLGRADTSGDDNNSLGSEISYDSTNASHHSEESNDEREHEREHEQGHDGDNLDNHAQNSSHPVTVHADVINENVLDDFFIESDADYRLSEFTEDQLRRCSTDTIIVGENRKYISGITEYEIDRSDYLFWKFNRLNDGSIQYQPSGPTGFYERFLLRTKFELGQKVTDYSGFSEETDMFFSCRVSGDILGDIKIFRDDLNGMDEAIDRASNRLINSWVEYAKYISGVKRGELLPTTELDEPIDGCYTVEQRVKILRESIYLDRRQLSNYKTLKRILPQRISQYEQEYEKVSYAFIYKGQSYHFEVLDENVSQNTPLTVIQIRNTIINRTKSLENAINDLSLERNQFDVNSQEWKNADKEMKAINNVKSMLESQLNLSEQLIKDMELAGDSPNDIISEHLNNSSEQVVNIINDEKEISEAENTINPQQASLEVTEEMQQSILRLQENFDRIKDDYNSNLKLIQSRFNESMGFYTQMDGEIGEMNNIQQFLVDVEIGSPEYNELKDEYINSYKKFCWRNDDFQVLDQDGMRLDIYTAEDGDFTELIFDLKNWNNNAYKNKDSIEAILKNYETLWDENMDLIINHMDAKYTRDYLLKQGINIYAYLDFKFDVTQFEIENITHPNELFNNTEDVNPIRTDTDSVPITNATNDEAVVQEFITKIDECNALQKELSAQKGVLANARKNVLVARRSVRELQEQILNDPSQQTLTHRTLYIANNTILNNNIEAYKNALSAYDDKIVNYNNAVQRYQAYFQAYNSILKNTFVDSTIDSFISVSPDIEDSLQTSIQTEISVDELFARLENNSGATNNLQNDLTGIDKNLNLETELVNHVTIIEDLKSKIIKKYDELIQESTAVRTLHYRLNYLNSQSKLTEQETEEYAAFYFDYNDMINSSYLKKLNDLIQIHNDYSLAVSDYKAFFQDNRFYITNNSQYRMDQFDDLGLNFEKIMFFGNGQPTVFPEPIWT